MEVMETTNLYSVLVPFYRGAVVFKLRIYDKLLMQIVLVPFYREAVVFIVHVSPFHFPTHLPYIYIIYLLSKVVKHYFSSFTSAISFIRVSKSFNF